MYNILIIDDDIEFLENRSRFLVEKNCIVKTAGTREIAMEYVRKETYDCILLDVMFPDTTGFELCDGIKKVTDSPVIFLSSLGDIESQIQGFEKGGIDYITKDCNLDLFFTKVKIRIEISKSSDVETTISFPPLRIDLKERMVFIDQSEIILTKTEFDILWLMATKPRYTWSIEEIYKDVWGYKDFDQSQTIQAHISRLRRKITKAFPKHYFIETVWGKGYKFIPKE